MNNRNNSSENRPIPDLVWANLLARLGQETTDARAASPDQVSASDLSSADMDDMELDGQLRTLVRSSSSAQFVDNVLNAVDTNLQSETTERFRLPTPALDEIPNDASPSHSELHNTSRLSVPIPVFEMTPSDVSPSDSPIDQDLPAALETQSHLKGFSFSKLLTVTCSLGLSLFIVLSIFDWTPSVPVNVADSGPRPNKKKKQAEALGPTNTSERASGSSQTNDLNRFEVANPTNYSGHQSNSTQHGITDNQPLALPKDIHDLFPGGMYVEPEPKPIAKNAPPNEVDAKVAKAEQIPKDNVPDKLVPVPVVKLIPDAELDWKLAIKFDRNGVGAIKLNGGEISEPLISDNASRLLLAVGSEVKRRFSFLEPRLGKRLKGVVTVGETNFYFDDGTKLNEAMELACTQISRLEFANHRAMGMMKLRAKFRLANNLLDHAVDGLNNTVDTSSNHNKAQAKAHAEFQSVDLMNQKGFFYYDNESHLIREIVGKTEQALQKMAVDRLAWEKLNSIKKMDQDDAFKRLAQERELANTSRTFISPEAFRQFSKSGMLILPQTHNSFTSTSIQKLSPSQLKTQLSRGTDSFDIFRDLTEFRSAENFVINETQALKSDPRLVELNKKIKGLQRKLRSAKDKEEKAQLASTMDDMQSKLHEIRTEAFEPLEELLSTRPDLKGLPLVMGEECHMDPDSASTMAQVSSTVGAAVSRFDGFGSRDISQNDDWRLAMIKNEIEMCFNLEDREQVFRTIDQILQIDHPRLRLELVETLRLRQKESPAGIEILVKRAKYDLVPEIRQAATNALSDYSIDGFREQLLDGLKYPWYIVAQHSAEALVRLDDQDAVPELVEMLKLANPRLPQKVDEDTYVQRELVAVNHMRNCLLCHAPSRAEEDLGRGLTPSWDRPIPINYYQAKQSGAFVRADIVYLRQDFSVLQTDQNDFWRNEQRFDYLVQNKKMSEKHARQAIKKIAKQRNLNREAIVFALRELTDQLPADDSYETWLAILEKRKVNANQDKKPKLNND